jgi:hypothetical protein
VYYYIYFPINFIDSYNNVSQCDTIVWLLSVRSFFFIILFLRKKEVVEPMQCSSYKSGEFDQTAFLKKVLCEVNMFLLDVLLLKA